MPPDVPTSGSPADWLRYARGDLALAQVSLPENSFYELLCFHAQQAAEKSIKAVLVNRGIAFPKIHIIEVQNLFVLPRDLPFKNSPPVNRMSLTRPPDRIDEK